MQPSTSTIPENRLWLHTRVQFPSTFTVYHIPVFDLRMCIIFRFQLSKRHRGGHIAKVDWLDRLTFREIELINEKEKRNSNFMYLMVEFPRFHRNDVDFSAVYYEMVGDGSLQ